MTGIDRFLELSASQSTQNQCTSGSVQDLVSENKVKSLEEDTGYLHLAYITIHTSTGNKSKIAQTPRKYLHFNYEKTELKLVKYLYT